MFGPETLYSMLISLLFLCLLQISDATYCVHCDAHSQQSSLFEKCINIKNDNETSYIKCNTDSFCFTGFTYNTSANSISRITRGCVTPQACYSAHRCNENQGCTLCCDSEYCNNQFPYQLLVDALSGKKLTTYKVVSYEYTVTYRKKYLAFVGLFILSAAFGIALLIFIFHRRKPKHIDLEMKHEVLTMKNTKFNATDDNDGEKLTVKNKNSGGQNENKTFLSTVKEIENEDFEE